MLVEVLFFASAREAAGDATATVEVPEGSSVGRVLAHLLERHPALRPARNSLRFAVNEDFVDADHVLRSGDRLALLPPLSGG
jgi:molybdopterin converting factor subunit 1